MSDVAVPDAPLAMVVGATGISGQALSASLVDRGWKVVGVSRRSPSELAGVDPVLLDLTNAAQVGETIAAIAPTHVFITAWAKMANESENIAVNGAIVRDVLAAAAGGGRLQHTALVTGLKHYMGPFEAYGTGEVRDTPFHEDEPRLPIPNFYYAQEDELWDAAEKNNFTWSVHRSHTIIGHAVGNAMNMGLTLAVQAALCREVGIPFVFPGNLAQWNGLTDMTDAGLLGEHMIWAAEMTASGRLPSQAYNVANGDVFRWRWMWPRLAQLLDVDAAACSESPRPLQQQMASDEFAQRWNQLAQRHGLVEPDINRVASWWHTDGDLNRPMECFTDMTRSRKGGFSRLISTLDSFATLFETLRRERVIPS
jgi:nucleoside-diphosphate-sugar epimerase